MKDATIIEVEIDGRGGCDVRLAGGLITAIGRRLERSGAIFEGHGGALLPGLIDHHVHLFALAARQQSLSLATSPALPQALKDADRALPPGDWIRAQDYDEAGQEPLDAAAIDRILSHRPIRIQHRSGELWILNTAALATMHGIELPAGAERDAAGRATGRFWREDRWLRAHLPASIPSLAAVGAMADGYGLIGLTDASATNDDAAARLLTRTARRDGLRARLMVMGGAGMTWPEDAAYVLGPVKILLDDDRLGALDELVRSIAQAHAERRAVAIHCVTGLQTAFAIAAWRTAGARAGDRIEHGSMIDDDLAREIADLGLTVITQPGFLFARGDRYLRDIGHDDTGQLYRNAGLRRSGVKVAGSSDAPYGPLDPWVAMRAAVDRRSSGGGLIGLREKVVPAQALALYLGRFADPAGPPRRVAIGQPADLCLMRQPIARVLGELSSDLVAGTFVDGNYRAA